MVDTASVSSDASPTQKNGSFLRTSFFGGGGQRRSSQRADNERLESLRVVSSDLLNATRTGDIAQIKSILGKNRSKVPEFIDFPDSNGWTALAWAALFSKMEAMDILQRNGASVNTPNHITGVTPIMGAAEAGLFPVVQYLVGVGADLNLQSKSGQTALMLAVETNRKEIVYFLLSQKSRIDLTTTNQDGFTAFLIAAQRDNVPMLEIFLATSTSFRDDTTSTPEGNGALHVAASAGALSAVKFLLSLASNAPPFPHHLSATNDDNSHANNHRRQVYTHPWSLNALNRQHSTPAIVAAKAGHNDVVQELILRGCDLDAVDQDGLSLAQLADQDTQQLLEQVAMRRRITSIFCCF